MKVIVIANQKGGVGKTTTSLALGDGLRLKGYSVLSIDSDSQRSMSKQFMAKEDDQETLYDVLVGNCTIDEAIQHTERGDIVAGDKLLRNIDAILNGMKRHLHLKHALENMEAEYDYVVIDTPPALNTINLNNFTACDEVIIPFNYEMMSLEGLVEFAETIRDVKSISNPNIRVAGILPVMVMSRTNVTKQLASQLDPFNKLLDTKTFNASIRRSTVQSEAHLLRESIFEHATGSAVATDYLDFVEEYLESEEK